MASINFGIDASGYKQGEKKNVVWDSKHVVNPHILIVGMSGSGKTHTLKRMVGQLQEHDDIRIHVFDVHGDIDIPGASDVQFSEQTSFGLNPLWINPDPHFGGVRKRIQAFIRILNKARALGAKQESVIRNLLTDLFEQHGFKLDDPKTWIVDSGDSQVDAIDDRVYLDIPFAEKDEAKALGAIWDGGNKKGWWIQTQNYKGSITKWQPRQFARRQLHLADLVNYAKYIQKKVFIGANQQAIIDLETFQRAARAHHRKTLDYFKKRESVEAAEAQEALEKAKDKAINSYVDFIKNVTTGEEFDSYLKFDSADVLKSVVDRLENLRSTGIFRSAEPPFDPDAKVWRYNLQALSMEERKLFVMFRLEDLFLQGIQRGEQSDIRDVFILDEAHAFCDDDPENIINSIAKEARKFGQSLIAASQAPNHFTEDFLTSVATKYVLAIDESFWDGASRKLRLDLKALEWIKPRQTCAVQIKAHTETKNAWQWVILPKKRVETE